MAVFTLAQRLARDMLAGVGGRKRLIPKNLNQRDNETIEDNCSCSNSIGCPRSILVFWLRTGARDLRTTSLYGANARKIVD